MIETPLRFQSGRGSLFGILHQSTAAVSFAPFVFCHPFAEEKLWTHRVFVSFARRLAGLGHPVLRFDYMGNGDSDGVFSESSLESALADVQSALAYVREATRTDEVNLLGLRLGATVASLAAETCPHIRDLILWAPIVDGGRYMQELLRVNLSTQMAVHKEIRQDRESLVQHLEQGHTVNVDGYEMAFPLYSQVSAVKLAAARKQHQGRCLIVNVDRQPERLSAEMQQLAATYPQVTLTAAREEPFWKEIPQFYQQAPSLFAVTSEWLRESLSGAGQADAPRGTRA